MRPRSGRAPESCWRGPVSGPARWPPWRRRGATSSRRPGLRRTRSSGRDCSTVQGGWRIRTPSSKPQKVSSRPHTNCLLRWTPTLRRRSPPASPRSSWSTGRAEQARSRLEAAFAAVADDEPDEDVVEVASRLGWALAVGGDYEQAREPTEFALRLSQALRLPQQLVRGLLTKACIARASDRPEEAFALLRHALRLALEHDLTEQAALAYGNLSDASFRSDRYSEALDALADGLVLARRIGSRHRELFMLAETSYALAMSGRWEEALAIYAGAARGSAANEHQPRERPQRGARDPDPPRAGRGGSFPLRPARVPPDVPELQDRAIHAGARAALLHAEGRHREAVEAGAEGREVRGRCSVPVSRASSRASSGRSPPRSRSARTRGRRSAAFDGRGATAWTAAALPRGPGAPLPRPDERRGSRLQDRCGRLSRVQLPLLARRYRARARRVARRQDRAAEAEPLFAERRRIFERLEASPWLERAAQVDLEPADVSS